MATQPESSAPAAGTQSGQRMVVIDIGKRKRKQIRKLRKGDGPLVEQIDQTIAQLKSEGTLDANAQTVVVVVRQKPRSNWIWT